MYSSPNLIFIVIYAITYTLYAYHNTVYYNVVYARGAQMFSIVGQISHLHIFTGPPLRRLQVDQHVVKQVLIMYCVCVSEVKPYTYTIYFI